MGSLKHFGEQTRLLFYHFYASRVRGISPLKALACFDEEEEEMRSQSESSRGQTNSRLGLEKLLNAPL